MANIRKRNGKFQAQVRRGGVFKSATFFKKSDAEAWARQVEAAVCSGRVQPFEYEPSCQKPNHRCGIIVPAILWAVLWVVLISVLREKV